MTHLETLQLALSNERSRLAAATNPSEIELRKVWVAQMEREVASEVQFVTAEMSDEALLAELGV